MTFDPFENQGGAGAWDPMVAAESNRAADELFAAEPDVTDDTFDPDEPSGPDEPEEPEESGELYDTTMPDPDLSSEAAEE